jgi:glycosyltransferase involved in cell wall biosynthesis
MPVFNAQETVCKSVLSILNQTFQDWELLVFDDGSTDATSELLKRISDPRITCYVDGKNIGIANRMNQAIYYAKGRYFARMDGDDLSYPNRLAKQIEYLEKNSNVDLVGSATLFFNNRGVAIGRQSVEIEHDIICGRPWDSIPIPHPTWMTKIEWIRKYKYSARSIMSEDQDLLLRAYKNSTYACIPEILLAYRQNKISMWKEMRSRISLAVDLIRFYGYKHNYIMAIFAFSFQLAKMLIASIAVMFGMKEILLYRRFGKLNEDELSYWESFYKVFDRPS